MRRSLQGNNCRLGRELWPRGAVELHRQAQQASSAFRDPPAPRARSLGHQLTHVQSFEEPANRCTGTLLRARSLRMTEQRFPYVAVAKATRDGVAIQYGHEQPHVLATRRVEAGIYSARPGLAQEFRR